MQEKALKELTELAFKFKDVYKELIQKSIEADDLQELVQRLVFVFVLKDCLQQMNEIVIEGYPKEVKHLIKSLTQKIVDGTIKDFELHRESTKH